jgi:hypothetical protein
MQLLSGSAIDTAFLVTAVDASFDAARLEPLRERSETDALTAAS